MAEPKGMVSMTKQPIGWPTHKYQHCLKTVMPSTATGTNMKLHYNVPKELLPSSIYNKMPGRWRTCTLPPVDSSNDWQQKEDTNQPVQEIRGTVSHSKSPHLNARPPSAYSESVILKPATRQDWLHNRRLDITKLKGLMRDNTYHPGNFSTLYKCTKEKVEGMVNRLSYDPYERREQLILTDNPEGNGNAPLYSKADIDNIVERLAIVKPAPEPTPEPEKKPLTKELSPKEKEVVDRLSKYEHPADKAPKDAEEKPEKKVVTEAQVEEMLKRLTQKHERKLPPVPQPHKSAKKVSLVDMEMILTRLTTYDSQKWPPESKPEIYKLHAKDL